MQIMVLGPLVALRDSVSIVPSAAKPRQVFSLLALNSNRVVSASLLIEEIWGDKPPRSAATTLQTYIFQLRRKLDATLRPDERLTAKDVVVTRHAGYVLAVPACDIDALEFERLSAEARLAAENGDNAGAADLFTSALALWNGPALVDVQAGGVLEPEIMRLEEARISAIEGRITARLRMGRHQELLSELTALTVKYPMNENMSAQFILALHRSGRSWRALEVYQKLRKTMIDEIGLEPSTRIRRLHQAVLSGHPALDLPGAVDDIEYEALPARDSISVRSAG